MRQTAASNKKYYLIFTLYFIGFGVAVALVTSFINYKSSFTDIENNLHNMANSETEFKRGLLFTKISEIEMQLSSIIRNELTLKYIKSGNRDDKENLNNLFYAMSYANNDMMQLRYIDASGKEVIRIDRDKKTPELLIVPDHQMQDKSQRYYYKETSLLMANQFWHSNIDLNVEHGKIEKPIKPTFRVAVQVVVENQFKGIVIANLLFDNTIKELTNTTNFHIYLADKDGEIIYNPDSEESWSKYLDSKKTLHDLYPKNVNQIINNKTFNTEGLYSYSLGDLFNNRENIKIIFIPKSFVMDSMQKKNIISALLVAATVLMVSIPLSWLVSIIPSQLQSKLATAYDKIRKNANIIDKYVMISKTDINGVINDISTNFTKITGYKASEVIGKKHSLIRHPDTPKDISEFIWETILSGKVWEGDIKNLDKNGNEFWIHNVISPEINKNGEIEGFTAISQDITDKKSIEIMSVTDSLTGLYNRNKLKDVLSSEMARFDRYNTDFSIILIDIDYFKKVNDTYGHQTGDDVLLHLSDILKNNIRETDCVSRWGGEEFLIVLSESNLDSAFKTADKLRFKVQNHEFPTAEEITISSGVAQYTKEETTSNLISRADDALYEAKKTGRNKVIKALGSLQNMT